MAKRIWFILGGLWLVLSGAYLFWHDFALSHNVAAIACGYPDAAAKAFADCMAWRLPQVDAMMWHWFLTSHLIWVVLPALALAGVGFLLRKRG